MKNWTIINNIKDEDNYEYQIEYNKEIGMYKVSIFKNNHFQDEIIFNEYKEENK